MPAATFGQWIKVTRAARRLTLSQVADRVGKSTAWISNLERDCSGSSKRFRQPRIETVDMIASALGETPEESRRLVDEARAASGYAPFSGSTETPDSRDNESTHMLASMVASHESRLLERISVNPAIFGGKPIVRGRRLAVEHVLGMLAAGDSVETLLEGYPWLEREDVLACLVFARRTVAHERIEPLQVDSAA